MKRMRQTMEHDTEGLGRDATGREGHGEAYTPKRSLGEIPLTQKDESSYSHTLLYALLHSPITSHSPSR